MDIILPLILTVYLLIIDFVDLFPFNDVTKHTKSVRKWEVINYILPPIAAIFSWIGHPVTLILAFLISLTYLIGHIISWWIPYFFGCSDERKEHMEHHFGKTIKILPPIKDHPIPNLEHLPVGILIVLWFIATCIALYWGLW